MLSDWVTLSSAGNTTSITSVSDTEALMAFFTSSSLKRDMISALGRFTSPASPLFLEMDFKGSSPFLLGLSHIYLPSLTGLAWTSLVILGAHPSVAE
eukprot:4876728-Ditylum_brightwellii.AAC.1